MIVLKAQDLAAATVADLEAAYLRLTARPVPVSWSRVVLERRVEMALLAATDRAAHAGVPRGATPDPYSAPPEPEEDAPEPPRPVLACVARVIAALPAPDAPVVRAKGKALRVRATGRGESRPRPGSERHAVLLYITTSEGQSATLSGMEAALGYDCAGHVRKLLDKNHLEVVYEVQSR